MKIDRVTVLGANSTIGAQIAGLFAAFSNSKVYLVSRTIDKSIAAIETAVKSIRADSIRPLLIPKTYEDLLECITDSDFIFESVAEDYEIRRNVFLSISKYIIPGTIIASGTSGLSIEKLAGIFDDVTRRRFFGVHFFNPPYNLQLLEFTTTKWSDLDVAEDLRKYLQEKLLRQLVNTRDKAAFLGNRIGFIFMNEVAQFALLYKNKGGIDYLDTILGPSTGRSMSPLATMDFVGLDIHKAIIDNIHNCEPDFFADEQVVPEYITHLVSCGKLGKKVGEGLYRTEFTSEGNKRYLVYDIETGAYRDRIQYSFAFLNKMKNCISDGLYKDAIDILKTDTTERLRFAGIF